MANLTHDAHPIPPEIENAIADYADGISEAVDATIGTPEWQSAARKKDAAWAAMKVAIAELTRDSERLDWIEAHGLPDPKVHDGHTLRQAIDDEKESPAAAVERGVRETTDDTARLDWIEARDDVWFVPLGGSDEWLVRRAVGEDDDTFFPSLRAAIDAARESETARSGYGSSSEEKP